MNPSLMDKEYTEIPLQKRHGGGRKTPKLKLKCHKDTYLMEELINKGIQGEELKDVGYS